MERNYVQILLDQLDTKHFVVLVGPRQSGKTTALKQVQKYIDKLSYPSVYINLENPLVLKSVNEHPENLLQYAGFFTKEHKEKLYILVDEVQYAADPSNLLKFLYDQYHEQIKIIATGSSSFYIDKKFKDSMMGRKRLIESGTLNFREYLRFTGHEPMLGELEKLSGTSKYKSLHKTKLLNLLEEYLLFGGYPEVVLADTEQEKRIVLEDIATNAAKKDLMDSGLTDDLKYFQLIRVIASQVGGQLNMNELSNFLKISYNKTEEMIYVAEKSFMIATVPPFFRNFRKELSKMPKVFFIDPGLRNYLVNDFRKLDERQDKGDILENYVFRLLWENYNSLDLHYWRTTDKYEVDFIVEEGREKGRAYEVKWDGGTAFSKGQLAFKTHYQNFPLKKICWQDPDEESIEILRFL